MSSSTQSELISSSPHSATDPKALADYNIGNLLLRMGKITQEDAVRIMKLHDERGLKFGEAAQSLGLVTEADIQQVLARQFNYPYLQQEESIYSSELVAAYQPFSKRSEVLREIRSQLMLHWFAAGKKALAISSATSGDGVSYLAANLAVIFSQLGVRTLLIDGNLRQPRQHEIFRLTEQKLGLSDILAGRAKLDVISNIVSFENLSVLAAGTLPPNPLELLSRAVFGQVIEKCASHYDVILVDTPAFTAGADAYAISAQLRGVVLATRQNKTSLNEIETIAEQLKQNTTQIVGSVLLDF